MQLVIKSFAFFVPFFLIISLYQSLYSTVRSLSRIIKVYKCELFISIKEIPIPVKSVYFLLCRLSIAKSWSCLMFLTNFFFHLFFMIQCFKQFVVCRVKFCFSYFEVFFELGFGNITRIAFLLITYITTS